MFNCTTFRNRKKSKYKYIRYNNVHILCLMSCMQRKVKFTYKDAKAEEILVEFLIGCH